MKEPENWAKSGEWKHDFVVESSILSIEACSNGEMELQMEDTLDINMVWMPFGLEDQRTLLRILVDNLQKHREALGGCPFAGIRFATPCPLCNIAESTVVKTVFLLEAAEEIELLGKGSPVSLAKAARLRCAIVEKGAA